MTEWLEEGQQQDVGERRRDARRLMSLSGVLHPGAATMTLVNLSFRGFRALCQLKEDEPPEQASVELDLSADEPPLLARARPVWFSKLETPGSLDCGFEFVDWPEGQKERLAAFIRDSVAVERRLGEGADLWTG